MQSSTNLIWIDLEMTGLDPAICRIIEIATVVTDSELNIIATGPTIAIHQPEPLLLAMDEWCTRTHTQSGLVERVRKSEITEAMAEAETIAFLQQYVPMQQSPMCGNSIHQDRRFLNRYMPLLENYFHYRHIDVSTIKELTKRWYPAALQGVEKTSHHLAMDDVIDSINELRYYREKVFIAKAS